MDGPDIDPLVLGTLRSPMLTQLMQSPMMKAEVGAIANEVKARYLIRLREHNDTGNLASTARVTYHRRQTRYDNRWEAEFSVGDSRADYARPLEEKYHILAQALRDLGFNIGDAGTVAPPNEPRTTVVYHRTTNEKAERILREGFRPTYRGGPEPGRQEYGFFTDDPEALRSYGSRVLRTEVPTSVLENDPNSGHYRVRLENLGRATFSDLAAREQEAGVSSGMTRQEPEPEAGMRSRRLRPGAYRVTLDDGREYHIEQLRTETPGYGVENRWWTTGVEGTEMPGFDPSRTKSEAMEDLRNMVQAERRHQQLRVQFRAEQED